MITTKILEIIPDASGRVIEERERGYCLLAEVPVNKGPFAVPKDGEKPPQAMVIKIEGEDYYIAGHSWEISLSQTAPDPGSILITLPAATLVLVVQALIPRSKIVVAPASAINQLDAITGNGRAN